MEKPYNENDGYVGFWISDHLYFVEGENFYNGARIYKRPNLFTSKLTKSSKIKTSPFGRRSRSDASCNTLIPYFQHLTLDKNISEYINIYKNGRKYYFKVYDASRESFSDSKGFIVIPNLDENIKICHELSPFNTMNINLASLICSQFSFQINLGQNYSKI